MDAYKRWVRRNRDYVHSLESLANGLTWLLPERFSESEIGPEAGFMIPNLSLTLEAVQSGKPGGNQRHDYLQNNYGHNSWNLEGRVLSALNRFGENARTASEPVVAEDSASARPPAPMVERPTLSKLLSAKGTIVALFVMGEVLFITRPLIYVLFIRKYGIRSWIPWFLSLAVDITGLGFLSLATRSRHVGKEQTFHLSTSEKDELKRRKLLWALHFMRDPFFSKYTRQRLESTGKQLEPIPIIGFIIGFLTGWFDF
ncbi:hypothetical protein WN943_014867 [Citrus x changshan-huyou]